MLLSLRHKFSVDNENWTDYINWVKLKNLKEVRSIDAKLNQYVGNCGDYECSYENLNVVKGMLPEISNGQYYLLAIDIQNEVSLNENLKDCNFLGYDLADDTCTSSILNCGELKGKLAVFKDKMNKYGLLDLENAKMVKNILPQQWGEKELHAKVTIWGLYEISK